MNSLTPDFCKRKHFESYGLWRTKTRSLCRTIRKKKSTRHQWFKNYWKEANERINAIITDVSNEKWLQKHTSVSQEDFEKDTTRNNLMIVFSRLLHMMYHAGQLGLLKTKK